MSLQPRFELMFAAGVVVVVLLKAGNTVIFSTAFSPVAPRMRIVGIPYIRLLLSNRDAIDLANSQDLLSYITDLSDYIHDVRRGAVSTRKPLR